MRKIKSIEIDVDKCNGCRACEVICSAFHAAPKYSSTNPEKSRIRLAFDPHRQMYVPVLAGEYTKFECNGRDTYIIDGKKYDECSFCRSSCPSRDLFTDPGSGLPLKCDMCEELPDGEEPLCVQWCLSDALTYKERDEEDDKEQTREEMEIGLESMVKQHGLKTVLDTIARLRTNTNDQDTMTKKQPRYKIQ